MLRSEFLSGTGAALLAEALPSASVTLGDEVFLRDTWRELRGRGVGIITNQSGVTSSLQSIVDAAVAHGKIRVRALFAPEHGLRGTHSAGATVSSYVDENTGLPVYSLYGATRHFTAATLKGIDVLLFDIQDVGSRAYTYISTMAYAMIDAKRYGREFWVLDRPNPVGGTIVEGPVLEPAFESFIGLYPIPMRHGMTVGELARLYNEHFEIGATLRVIPMEGWHRSTIWPQTGLQWVQTSPYMPTWQTTFVYSCTGLIDNAGLNNGTGFTKPFFLAGSDRVEGDRLAQALNALDLPGVWFRPAAWSPISGFWKDKVLTGVELMVFAPEKFLAVRTSVEILTAVHRLFPSAITVKAHALDLDWGTASLREQLLAGANAHEILGGWNARLEDFKALRERYLLY